MNAESTHHLDIEELLAVVDGTLLDEEAQVHLAACSACRSDAERWTAVALGVRHLAAAVPPPRTLSFDQPPALDPESPSVPQSGVHPVAGRPRRRALVAAAAALLVIGGGSYGLSVALGGGGARPLRAEDRRRSRRASPR